MRVDNIGIHETHHAGRHPPALPDPRSGRRRHTLRHHVRRRHCGKRHRIRRRTVTRRHASRAASYKLKTNTQRQSVWQVPAAAMLSSVRVGYQPAGSLKTYPFDLFRTGLDVTECYTKSKKTALVASPETGGRALDEPKNQKTKQTQFDPLFSTKTQNESQFHRPIDNRPQVEQPAPQAPDPLPGWIMVVS